MEIIKMVPLENRCTICNFRLTPRDMKEGKKICQMCIKKGLHLEQEA